MIGRRLCIVVAVVVLMSVLAPAAHVDAGPEELAASLSAAPVGSRIHYQGRLTDSGGVPLSGSHNLRFELYTAASGGAKLWEQTKNAVQVTSGLFTVQLEVNPQDYTGQALWLAVSVDGQLLSGRQELLPVPYAISLRPGARIVGDAQDGLTSLTTGSFGLHGESSSPTLGAGVFGQNTGGVGHGVQGISAGEAGVAGYGRGNGSYGVLGEVGTGGDAGVFGSVAAGGGDGVLGQTSSDANGSAGVWGTAAAETGKTYGVAGECHSPSGFGGYFTNLAAGGSGLYVSGGSDDAPDLVLGGWAGSEEGRIASDPAFASSDILLFSNDDVTVELDENNDELGRFKVLNGADLEVFTVDEDGEVSVRDLTVTGALDSNGPRCVQYDFVTAGLSQIEVPGFCFGHLCQVLVFSDGTFGAFGPGLLWPVYYMQDLVGNGWIGGPNISIGDVAHSDGRGTNGNSTREAVHRGGSTAGGGHMSVLDDSTAENSAFHWTVDFQPYGSELTRATVYICPQGSPVVAP
jgi:hypothetical protein